MVNEYKFFYKQNKYEDLVIDKSKLLITKLVILLSVSFISLIFVIINRCSFMCFILLEIGFIVSLFQKNNIIFLLLKIFFALLYFYVSKLYMVYLVGLYYYMFYIIISIISYFYKDDFKFSFSKRITFYNYMIIINIGAIIWLLMVLLSNMMGGKLIILDSLCVVFLIINYIVQKERYFDYCIINFIADSLLFILWSLVYLKTFSTSVVLLVMLYLSLIFYDVIYYIFINKALLDDNISKNVNTK